MQSLIMKLLPGHPEPEVISYRNHAGHISRAPHWEGTSTLGNLKAESRLCLGSGPLSI
jgi:hypothetical protein